MAKSWNGGADLEFSALTIANNHLTILRQLHRIPARRVLLQYFIRLKAALVGEKGRDTCGKSNRVLHTEQLSEKGKMGFP